MKVVVIGANGQLGSDIFKVYKDKGNTMHALNHNNIDIAEADSCMEVIKRIQPELLINTAAMHNVELCEQFPEKSFKVNGLGARNLAINSTKSMTGHLLGAAAAVEFLVLIQTLNNQKAHPTINYETPDPDCDLDYIPNEAREIEAQYALSNSLGFGGHNSVLIAGRYTN